VGIIGNSIFPGSLIIWENYFELEYPTENGFNLFLFRSQESDLNPQIINLEKALSDYGFDAFTVESLVIENILIENTYISIFQVLLVLALVIGTFGFGIVASRNALERRHEIGVLRAIGFKRKAVYRAMLYENSYIILAGIAIGSLSGIIASSVYLLKLDMNILSWPWLYVTAIVAVSFIIAMVSTVIPVIRSSKIQISQAIKVRE
jgi:putative ABC transport system permease protein